MNTNPSGFPFVSFCAPIIRFERDGATILVNEVQTLPSVSGAPACYRCVTYADGSLLRVEYGNEDQVNAILRDLLGKGPHSSPLTSELCKIEKDKALASLCR